MEEKKIHISLSTVFLIIAIIIIIIMGYIIYTLSNSKSKADNEIQTLKAETQNMQTTLSTIQNYMNNTNISDNTSSNVSLQNNSENEIESTIQSKDNQKTDEEKVKEIARDFVKAVNKKDWNTVEKYSSIQIVNYLKEYNVSNMSVDLNTLEENPITDNGYYCRSSYDINYNGLTPKDLSLGNLFCVEKVNDAFVVTSPFATGR